MFLAEIIKAEIIKQTKDLYEPTEDVINEYVYNASHQIAKKIYMSTISPYSQNVYPLL